MTEIADEIDDARADLERLEGELGRPELTRATAEGELGAFRADLDHRVAALRADLDTIDAELARVRAARAPDERDAAEGLRRATEAARESAAAASAAKPPRQRSDAAADLRKLYREAARTFHPDHAQDEDDRRTREDAMQQAVGAYEEGDANKLRRLLDEWRERSHAVGDSASSAELKRQSRRIHQLSARIDAIRARVVPQPMPEASNLKASDLKRHAENVAREGRNMLEQLQGEASDAVDSAREGLRRLQGR